MTKKDLIKFLRPFMDEISIEGEDGQEATFRYICEEGKGKIIVGLTKEEENR